MSDRPPVLVCDPLHQAGLDILQQVADVDLHPGIGDADLLAIIGRYQGLIVGPHRRLEQQVIEAGFNLRVIGCAGSRLDQIDVTAARTMGIEVRSSPSDNAVAIAEHALAQMLLLSYQAASAGSGAGRGLAGKSLGIIGFGLIGRQVAQRALAFNMHVIVNQPRLTPELALDEGVDVADLIDLLQASDFVSLHVPFKAETKALIGREELSLMKPSAYLVNTGHTGLIDDGALLEALEAGRIAGAALPEFPPHMLESESAIHVGEQAVLVRRHPSVIVAPHVSTIIGDRLQEVSVSIAQQVVERIRVKRPSESLALEVVPIGQVSPHEAIDEKRVQRLMHNLEEAGRLINPPLVTQWNNRYVILDGATRFSALKQLGYPYLIVQLIDAQRDDFELHTWYHAISSDESLDDLLNHLANVPGLRLSRLAADRLSDAFAHEQALSYFLAPDGSAILAETTPDSDRLLVMNHLVAAYTSWGRVERTLLTDLARLQAQFPRLTAVAVFPQFAPETVFEVASRGELLPAGLTRFIIPGRILRLNADLPQLKKDEPLAAKRAWFNQFLAEKLARSRLRYYQEPVILLDE